MEEKKTSTADILAKIRAQKAAAAEGAPAPTPEAAPVAEPAPPAAAVAPPAAAPAKPAAPAAKPGSTADILAAIRAKKAGAAPAAEAPAASAAAAPIVAAATAAPIPAATGPAKPLPSIAEMVRAAKPGAPAPAATTKPVLVAPPMPTKPVLSSGKKAPAPVRRSLAGLVTITLVSLVSLVLGAAFSSPVLVAVGVLIWCVLLTPFALAWTSLTAVTGIATLGTARFMFPNVLVEPPSKFKIGPLSDYPLNAVSNKWKDQFGVWIVHTDQYEGKDLIYALSTVCTHLGCTPSWLDGEQKFKCPCHGSGFYITGVNFEGPAPRPLERVGLRIAEDGMLEVDKSVKFQEEMGQWVDGTSFVDGSLA